MMDLMDTQKSQPDDISKKAAALARSEGVEWKGLPQEQKREFKKRIRSERQDKPASQ